MLPIYVGLKNSFTDRVLENIELQLSRLGLLFVDDKIVIPAESQKQGTDALDFVHLGTTEIITEEEVFWLHNMQKDI